MSFTWISTGTWRRRILRSSCRSARLFELEVHYIDSLDRIWQNAIALQNFTLQGGLEKPPAERKMKGT